jgi:hypothetical protein
MTDINALRLEYKNAVVKALTGGGNPGNLRANFKARGLSDAIMDEVNSEVMVPKKP